MPNFTLKTCFESHTHQDSSIINDIEKTLSLLKANLSNKNEILLAFYAFLYLQCHSDKKQYSEKEKTYLKKVYLENEQEIEKKLKNNKFKNLVLHLTEKRNSTIKDIKTWIKNFGEEINAKSYEQSI